MRKPGRFLAILLVVCILLSNTSPVFAAITTKTSTPAAPTLSYTPMKPTNGNVIVTVYYPIIAVVKQYKLGASGTWTTYTGPITITSNTSVTARYQNSKGIWSNLGGVTISNIDKTAPVKPVITPSTTAPTNQNVSVSISYSTDSTVKQYKIGSAGIWTNYTSAVFISTNNTIYAKSVDAVGNWSSETSYIVNNIDKTPPVVPILQADITSMTNKNVNVTVTYPQDASIKQYKIGTSSTWVSYTGPIAVSVNDVVYAKAQDAAGNWSNEGSITIANIDKTAPANPSFNFSTTQATNQDVTVTVNFSSDSVYKKVKLGSEGIWKDYTGPFIISTNDTIYAKAGDEAGNWSPEANYIISNIDKTAPSNPILEASTTAPTNQSVALTITYSADSDMRLYKIGADGIWTDYTSPITVSENNTIYAKAADKAGNWSAETNCTIDNIDTIAPQTPIIAASMSTPTTQPVTITISYSTDSITNQYKIGTDGAWASYTAPVIVSANSDIYARSIDAAGNISNEAYYSVINISTIAPKIVLGYTVKYSSTDVTSYNSMVANAAALNEIATATFNVDGYGNLTGTAPADQISFANSSGIKPNLMVSNNFDANIASQLLNSPQNRQLLQDNILNLLKTYNYKGVDIDIENIPASCRDNFTSFMSELYSTLKPLGYGVSVAVQAKTYDSPNATWNYAFDYKSLAQYTDYLMIMGYDEHYPGGTPGAIASIDWITKVVDYALTVVPKEKIVLGLAAYGYDWSGTTTKAYSISNCIGLANQYGATINFDSTTKSKYFSYTVNGVAHTVWFEDGDTIAYKLDLVNSRDLKGIGIWRLGLEDANYWSTIKAKLNK